MKYFMTGQEKGDLLIKVTTWACLTVLVRDLQDNSFVFEELRASIWICQCQV